MQRRQAISLVVLAGLLAIALLSRLLVGDSEGGLHWPESRQFLALRLHRAAVALTVGAALSVAGVLLQALLRNPLASPDLMGVTAGASLGVAATAFVTMLVTGATVASPAAQSVAALIGSLGTLGIVLAWTVRRGGIDVVSLVLVGVIVGMTCAGITLLLHSLMPDGGFSARAWLLGSINEELSPLTLGVGAGLCAFCLAGTVATGPSIDTATFGEDEARSLGVRLAWLRFSLFLVAGLLTTISVVFAGPIGFVGLIVPHAVRMLMGPHHRPLLIGAALGGGATLVAADAAVSALPMLIGGGRLPLGVVTAIAGGPLFLLLLRTTLTRRAL